MNQKILLGKFEKKYLFLFLFLTFFSLTQTFAQGNFTVSGKVLDGDDESLGLIGAYIVEKGTTNGAATDVNGDFSIKVANGNAVLIVTYTGYSTQEVAVANRNSFNIVLSVDAGASQNVAVTI